MMTEKLIFPYGITETITEEEYQKSLEPYEQQKELFCNLKAWSDHAAEVLKSHGYTDFQTYGGTYKLICHPQSIESDDNKVRDAESVLRAVHDVHDAIFQDDKCRIANAGIVLGLAISRADSEPKEKFAILGKKMNGSEIQKNRTELFWDKYHGKYTKLDRSHYSHNQVWALNQIGKTIESDVAWPIKNPIKGKRPDMRTLREQLVVKRK